MEKIETIKRDLELYLGLTRRYREVVEKFEPGATRLQYYDGMIDAIQNMIQLVESRIDE